MDQSASSIQFFTAFQLSDIWFLGEAAGRTLLSATLSIPGGTVLGIFFGWVLSVSGWAGASSLGLILDVFRSVPLIIQLILFFNFFPIIGIPLDPFQAGTVVLMFYTSALVAAVARGGIEAVEVTLRRAARSLGGAGSRRTQVDDSRATRVDRARPLRSLASLTVRGMGG